MTDLGNQVTSETVLKTELVAVMMMDEVPGSPVVR